MFHRQVPQINMDYAATLQETLLTTIISKNRCQLGAQTSVHPELMRSETGKREQRYAEGVDIELREHLMQQHADHTKDSEGTLFRVRCFGYSAIEDTWKLGKTIPQDFVARYRKRSQNSPASYRRENEAAKAGETEKTSWKEKSVSEKRHSRNRAVWEREGCTRKARTSMSDRNAIPGAQPLSQSLLTSTSRMGCPRKGS